MLEQVSPASVHNKLVAGVAAEQLAAGNKRAYIKKKTQMVGFAANQAKLQLLAMCELIFTEALEVGSEDEIAAAHADLTEAQAQVDAMRPMAPRPVQRGRRCVVRELLEGLGLKGVELKVVALMAGSGGIEWLLKHSGLALRLDWVRAKAAAAATLPPEIRCVHPLHLYGPHRQRYVADAFFNVDGLITDLANINSKSPLGLLLQAYLNIADLRKTTAFLRAHAQLLAAINDLSKERVNLVSSSQLGGSFICDTPAGTCAASSAA